MGFSNRRFFSYNYDSISLNLYKNHGIFFVKDPSKIVLASGNVLLSLLGYCPYGYVFSEDRIERLKFPLDSGTSTTVGRLSESRSSLSANNSSVHGYVCGGSDKSTIDRFQFPLDSGNAIRAGSLSIGRSGLSANNSSVIGYVCGGYYNSNYHISTIDKFMFPLDYGYVVHDFNLSYIRSRMSANNSSVHGYVCGGCYYTGYYLNIVDRFQFSFDSGYSAPTGYLSGSNRFDLSANNSSVHGYVCGGSSYSNYIRYLSIIDRFQFPFDSGYASQVGNLSSIKSCLSANNSSFHGYVCGGTYSDDNGSVVVSAIDRFLFPLCYGGASQSGNLSDGAYSLSANDMICP